MTDIYLKDLSYRKAETDALISDEAIRVDGELTKRSLVSDEGIPGGMATLDNAGDLAVNQVPFASLLESGDDLNTVKVLSPHTLQYQLENYDTSIEADVKFGDLESDGSVQMGTAYNPQQPKDIATVDYVLALVGGVTRNFVVDTLAEMLLLTGVKLADSCFVMNDVGTPSNEGEYKALQDDPTDITHWTKIESTTAWGNIIGTLSNQTDLQVALNNKADTTVTDTNTTDITSIELKTDYITVNQAVDLDQIELSANTNTTSITSLNTTVGINTDNITTNTSNIGSLTSTVSNNTDKVNDHSLAITDIENGDTVLIKQTFAPMADTSALTEGQVAYDNVSKTLVVKSDIANQTLNVGQETLIRVYNGTGSTLYNGAIVKQIGVEFGVVSVGLASADTFINARTVGILTHDLPHGEEGYTTTFGRVIEVPTNQNAEAWTIAESLYLSSTVLGGITNVLPPIGSFIGRLLTNNGTTGTVFAAPRNLITLPPVGGWMKAIPTTINPGSGYSQFSGFTDVSTSAGIVGDGVTGIFGIDYSGTYEITLSVSFSGITAQNNGSIITIEIYNVNGGVSLFEYNIIVGRNDTVASGTTITQGDFTDNGQLAARYKETSGDVGGAVSIDNISFLVKSILIR